MKAPTQSLSVLLVDDERLAGKLLAELLRAHRELEVIGYAASVEEALALATKFRPDVVFLDIQMPRRNGFELASVLSTMETPPLVVFVTAHEAYAVRAFEAAAVDYLLKPVHPTRLAKTVDRLMAASRVRPCQGTAVDAGMSVSTGPAPNAGISRTGSGDVEVLRDGRDIRLVKPSEIRAIQTQGSYTRLLFEADSSSMVKLPLSHWESRLPETLFFKASRSLLVNIASIVRLAHVDRNRTLLYLSGISQPLVLSRLESFRVRREIQRVQQAGSAEGRF
jgi:two-component system LytT family response regulator